MSTTQETSVTSSQDRFAPAVEVGKKTSNIIVKLNVETKNDVDNNDVIKFTVEQLFPWITEFKKKCRCSMAQPNIVALIRLMKFYARNVSINVTECYTKPYRAAKLKDSISESLLFFLFYFRELVEVCDKNSYLDKMSDLLAMYMDMELKASRRGKEHHGKIAARLTSCLYVYLENSSEHILDTFIKARFINRNYHDILDPVLTKISKSMLASPNCDTMYVRYLLIYRLWKKVNNDAAVKNQINSTAILHLGSPPANPTPFLAKYVLPKVPKSQANSTKFLLLHKFDIEKSCRLFIQYCKENREDEDLADFDKSNFAADNLETLGGRGAIHMDNPMNNVNILPEGERRQGTGVKTKCSNGGDSLQKIIGKTESGDEISPLKPAKAPLRQKTKKNGDILFIDLTADEITEKVIKKKKHPKIHWLTEVKKKLNTKAKTAEKKRKAQIIASDDSILSGLVDSTSAGSLSTATTPEPLIFPSDPLVKSSENCVTSNFVENEEFVGEKPACDVTTTVQESIKSDPVPSFEKETVGQTPTNHTINKILSDSCHTTSERNEIFAEETESWTVNELSNALSHICESYESDNSEEKIDPKLAAKTDSVDGEITSQSEKETEMAENLDNCQRTTSESSEVAVIFTRRGSDVEIVDLDEYTEEVRDTESIEGSDEICKLENTEGESDSIPNWDGENSESTGINGDVKDLTTQTGKLKLTNRAEVLNDEETKKADSPEEQSFDANFVDSRKLDEVGFNLESSRDCKIERNVVENFGPSKEIERHCDHESSKVGVLEIEKRNGIRSAEKKLAIIESEYVDNEKLIPKINEIIIPTNDVENISSNLLTNEEEPQFGDNIDGLSLLASVSQHVSHLGEYSDNSLSKPKIINGEVPGVLSTVKNDVVPLILETTMDLNSSRLQNNLIPVDNVTQMIKESTNVIVNGETVVLFQKSPNSNLYIINKASENGTEEKKSIERNLTTMRDIINHIPINLSENQEAVKNLRKTQVRGDPRKLSNQLKPLRNKFEDEYIKKEHVDGDYYKDYFVQRRNDTPESVSELKKSPQVIGPADTPLLKQQEFICEDSSATGRLNRNWEKRESTSNENLINYKKSIKQEFGSFGDHQQVARLNYHNINTVESIDSPNYSTVTTTTNFYEHCNFPTCSLKVSSSQSSYQPHCAYNVHPATAVAHLPYVQNSYFLATESPSKPDDRDLKLNEAALAKLKDDQLLHKIEQSIMEDKKVEPTAIIPEIKYKPEFDNKLPLKKRLKAHAMLSMNFDNDNNEQVKSQRVENYPGTPMMSIAALESRDVASPRYEDKHSLELSPRVKNDSLSGHTTEMIRRDYLKDTPLASIGNSTNVNIMAVGNQRSFKTPALRNDLGITSPLKRAAPSLANPKSPKKEKKSKALTNGRQTRSSKRNIPKVDYSYDGIIDTELKFNSSNELKRKRKRTSR